MKFIANSQALHTELAFLAGVVNSKASTIPVLQNVLLESTGKTAIKLTGSDLDVTLTCEADAHVVKAGAILVPLSKLLAITKTLPKTADITLESLNTGGAKVTCERASFKLMAPARDQFPELPEIKEGGLEVPSDSFRAMIDSTIYAITEEESRYTLSGTKVEIDQTGMRMITTDGHRLAFTEIKEFSAKDKTEVLIPRKALGELAKISAAHEGSLRFVAEENHIYFQVGTRTLSSRLLSGQFPNYEIVIPKSNDQEVIASGSAIREAVRRVALMADDRSKAIRLEIKPGELRISASSAEHGEAVEAIPVEFEGEEITIGFNSKYLIDYYNLIDGDSSVKMAFKDGNSQVLLTPAAAGAMNTFGIIMPMRV
jgi:DNA polymerase-3 subunit beta